VFKHQTGRETPTPPQLTNPTDHPMKSLIATVAAASILLVAQAPAFASDRGKEVKPIGNVSIKARSDNANKVAAGLALGAVVVGVVIASRAHAAQQHEGARCRMWRNDCRFGSDRACYIYDTRC
jgi:hypothetical protein